MTKMARGIRRATMRGASRPAFVPPVLAEYRTYREFKSTRLWFWRFRLQQQAWAALREWRHNRTPTFNPAEAIPIAQPMSVEKFVTHCERREAQRREALRQLWLVRG